MNASLTVTLESRQFPATSGSCLTLVLGARFVQTRTFPDRPVVNS